MPEVENRGELEAFRQYIRDMVEVRKAKDGTLAAVVNVEELGVEEMLLWEQYKKIMLYLSDFNQKLEKDELSQRLDLLIALSKDFGAKVDAEIAKEVNKTATSKLQFLGFLNNRNPIMKLNLVKSRFSDRSFTPSALIKKLKSDLAGSIDLYARNGWKEVKT